jgi:hypothetical protein
MEKFKLMVNGQQKDVTADPSTPLLWVLREDLNMTGYKVRLRHRRLRSVHGTSGRRADPFLRGSHFSGRRASHCHHRSYCR